MYCISIFLYLYFVLYIDTIEYFIKTYTNNVNSSHIHRCTHINLVLDFWFEYKCLLSSGVNAQIVLTSFLTQCVKIDINAICEIMSIIVRRTTSQ